MHLGYHCAAGCVSNRDPGYRFESELQCACVTASNTNTYTQQLQPWERGWIRAKNVTHQPGRQAQRRHSGAASV